MGTLKDMRITFFYADETIFDTVKKWKTRERLVKWADEFYARYGFKIDQFPVAWNEKIYKRDFCLLKKDGLKIFYTLDSKIIEGKILTLREEQLKLAGNYSSLTYDEDPNSDYQKSDKRFWEVSDLLEDAIDVKNQINFERPLAFRKLIWTKFSQTKLDFSKRLVVVFCEFEDGLKEYGIKPDAIGETFSKDFDTLFLLLWDTFAPVGSEIFPGVLIFIDINSMTKKYEYTLAHEIVHAAGSTTRDNQGTKGNIMIYADAEGKIPTNVNLEANDKTRLDVAFFVV